MKEVNNILYTTSFMLLTVFTNEIKNTPILPKFTKERQLNTFYNKKVTNKELKYILLWSKTKLTELAFLGEGQEGFIARNCTYTNCYSTFDKQFLGDITEFDVIAFPGNEIVNWEMKDIIPAKRSPHQKYAFATIESADNYPVCSDKLNGFFNWTWTYRFDSDAQWGYIVVRDVDGKIIGPRRDMHWMKLEQMAPVSRKLKNTLLRNKTRAAAWFVSHCKTLSGREHFVKALQKELARYGLEVDIYGDCGPYKCGVNELRCYQIIKYYYYFYLAFENSFSEYYVTEKVLSGLLYNAVPIVYGAANYTRFMPDGIYLNARELGPKKLAKKMRYLIDHPDAYIEYFRWINHYSFYSRNDDPSTNDYCGFCELVNNKKMMESHSSYMNFNKWWSEPKRCLHFGEHF